MIEHIGKGVYRIVPQCKGCEAVLSKEELFYAACFRAGWRKLCRKCMDEGVR